MITENIEMIISVCVSKKKTDKCIKSKCTLNKKRIQYKNIQTGYGMLLEEEVRWNLLRSDA